MNPANDTGLLVFGDVATAIAAVAALVTVGLTVRYGRKTAIELGAQVTELRGITSGLAEQLNELTFIGVSLSGVEQGIGDTAEILRGAQAAEARHRERERLERRVDRYAAVGSLVEAIFWAAYNEGQGNEWMELRNRLSVLLVGMATDLPRCADVRTANSRPDAQMKAGTARGEADIAIERLIARIGVLDAE